MSEWLESPAEGTMSEPVEDGAPFFFAMGEPPSATAIDDDVYPTVTAAVPPFSGDTAAIDIILSLDYAIRAIAELSRAVALAAKDETH
jgi:hypothetical protein